MNRNALVINGHNGDDTTSLVDSEFLSFIPMSIFSRCKRDLAIVSMNSNPMHLPWKDVKRTIDKVHTHVCGHANYTDFKLLLQRNNMWNEQVDTYVTNIISNCPSCNSTAHPQPKRMVSISTLSKKFNQILCVDHFYLDDVCSVHFMDLVSRFSTAQIVENTNQHDVVPPFESTWIPHFWYPESIRGDQAFGQGSFFKYMKSIDIIFELVPKNRHYKKPIESKNSIIRSIYERLKDHGQKAKNFDQIQSALKSVSISNDLYGNILMSSFELAKGYTRPLMSKANEIPPDIVEAQQNLNAKRKLTLILKSKSVSEIPVSVGDMVETYSVTKSDKRGHWSEPKKVD